MQSYMPTLHLRLKVPLHVPKVYLAWTTRAIEVNSLFIYFLFFNYLGNLDRLPPLYLFIYININHYNSYLLSHASIVNPLLPLCAANETSKSTCSSSSSSSSSCSLSLTKWAEHRSGSGASSAWKSPRRGFHTPQLRRSLPKRNGDGASWSRTERKITTPSNTPTKQLRRRRLRRQPRTGTRLAWREIQPSTRWRWPRLLRRSRRLLTRLPKLLPRWLGWPAAGGAPDTPPRCTVAAASSLWRVMNGQRWGFSPLFEAAW